MQEVRYDGIRVSYVMPGSVATGFGRGDEVTGADWKIAPEEVAEVVVNLLRHDRAQPAEPRRAAALQAPEEVIPARRDCERMSSTQRRGARRAEMPKILGVLCV